MSTIPLVWHYGLMADYWSEFLCDAPEVPFVTAFIARFGEPALDLGCGTGRVLLPLLRAGVDVDGADVSADMIRLAREAVLRERLATGLFVQPMHEMALPRRYRTIYMLGSFGLSGDRANDLHCLRRCRDHLEPGGALLFNMPMQYTSREDWEPWLSESRQRMPESWPQRGSPRLSKDGSQRYLQIRVLDVDALTQTYTREARLEKWVGGELVKAENYVLRGTLYLMQELLLMLKCAGFRDVAVRGGYSDEVPTRYHEELVFEAIR